jgi:nicotinamidase-related amidase
MTTPAIPRLRRTQAGVVVVDIQDRLLPQIFEKERLVQKTVLLLKGAAILSLPIFATEQYRKGLGVTAPEIAAAIKDFSPLEKVTFSSCGAAGFVEALKAKGTADVLLCGMEAHICVLQTCLDLLEQKQFRVFVVADAVSSRSEENTRLALERMRTAGAEIVSTEMVLFELLGRAATDEFKQILALVR